MESIFFSFFVLFIHIVIFIGEPTFYRSKEEQCLDIYYKFTYLAHFCVCFLRQEMFTQE